MIGSLGLGIAIVGGVAFLSQLAHWSGTGEWRALSLRSLLVDPPLGSILPESLFAWLAHLGDAGGLTQLANAVLDRTPGPAVLFLLGGAIVWASLRWESTASRL